MTGQKDSYCLFKAKEKNKNKNKNKNKKVRDIGIATRVSCVLLWTYQSQ
jgi:hypothetical protein